MEIQVILPPAPDEVIPDREADRLFQELIERGDDGEFDPNNTECAAEDELTELVFETWGSAAQWLFES